MKVRQWLHDRIFPHCRGVRPVPFRLSKEPEFVSFWDRPLVEAEGERWELFLHDWQGDHIPVQDTEDVLSRLDHPEHFA